MNRIASLSFAVCAVFGQTSSWAENKLTDTAPAAGNTADSGLVEIVVTAQRRSESSQRAPIALSVLSGDALAQADISRPTELTNVVPSLQVAAAAGPYTLFYLRGVGNFNGNSLSDSAVAFNTDGVFVGRPSSTTGFFYDVDRIEVLKGPQGTLYGRNATGGAINVISKRPDLNAFGGDVNVEYGNYATVRADGAINVPISGDMAFRAAGIYVNHSGYMQDGTDDQKDYGGRLSFLAEPNDDLHIFVVGDYFHQGGNGVGATPDGTPLSDRVGILSGGGQAFYAAQPNTLNGRTFRGIDVDSYQDNHFWGLSSTVDWTVPGGTFTLIPAYRSGHLDYASLASGFYIRQKEDDNQKSFEGRFASKFDGPVNFIAGAFVYDEDNSVPLVAYNHQSNASFQSIETVTNSKAGFAQLTYDVVKNVRLSLGGRYTHESKDFSGTLAAPSVVCVFPTQYFPTYTPGCPDAPQLPYNVYVPPVPHFVPGADGTIGTLAGLNETGANARQTSFSKFTYRGGIDWNVTDQNMLYASYETGFKSGGFFFSTDNGVYQPESLSALTIGSKNRAFDNKLQANVELFYWRYKDQQVSHLGVDSAGIAIFPTQNVGRGVFKGFELDLQYLPLPGTLLTGDIQYLSARYNNFVYSTPNFNGGVSNGTGCPSDGAPGLFYTVDCSGKQPPNAPLWTVNLGAQQTVSLSGGNKLVGSVRTHFQTTTLTGLEFEPVETQGSYWLADGALSFLTSDDRFSVGGYVNNAFNRTVIGSTFPPPFGFFTVSTLRPPRTFGLRVGYKF